MVNFINRFKQLNNNQVWFLSGQNISEALTEILDETYDAINQNSVVVTKYLEFSKAFDTVDREFLLKNVLLLLQGVFLLSNIIPGDHL